MEEYCGWPDVSAFHKHCKAFTPFVSRQVEYKNAFDFSTLKALAGEHEVEVACSKEQEFSGDENKAESIKMKLKTYLQGYDANMRKEGHWILDVPQMDLYLSQLTVFSGGSETSDNNNLEILSPAHFPDILSSAEVHEANVWVNINPVSSSLHYDGNHNLLFIGCGCKELLLISPCETKLLKPSAMNSSTPNHSSLCREEILSHFHSIGQHSESAFNVSLQAGDCVFIPEGWWHQVSSMANTFAVNFWFRSPLHAIISGTNFSSLSPYIIRTAFHSMLSSYLESWCPCKNPNSFELPCGAKATYSVSDFSYPVDLFNCTPSNSSSKIKTPLQRNCLLELCAIFSSASLCDMESYWIEFARRNMPMWSLVLLELNPEQCFNLIRTWESEGPPVEINGVTIRKLSVKDICQELLVTYCGSEAECAKVKDHIITSKSLFVCRILNSEIIPSIIDTDGFIATHKKKEHNKRISICSENVDKDHVAKSQKKC